MYSDMYSYIDMHCDTLLRCLRTEGDELYNGEGMQSLVQMHKAKQLCQFFAIFFPPKNTKELSHLSDEELFCILRDRLYSDVEKHSDIIAMAHNYDEIMVNQKRGLSSAILTVEDGRMVDGSMEKLKYMYDKGVRAIALTWNFANCFGFPHSRDKAIMSKGLTDFGKEAVKEMNRLGILTDVSHLSDAGFYDVADCSDKPFIASHSNCRAIAPHTRNLTDDMIRLLAEKGGVSGLNFCPAFVGPDIDTQESLVENMVEHVMHFIKVGGEDCVGIGTDFDGMDGYLEINSPTCMYKLFDALAKKGLSPRQLDKIAAQNVLRVIKESI